MGALTTEPLLLCVFMADSYEVLISEDSKRKFGEKTYKSKGSVVRAPVQGAPTLTHFACTHTHTYTGHACPVLLLRPSKLYTRLCALNILMLARTHAHPLCMHAHTFCMHARTHIHTQGMPGLYCLPRPGSFKLHWGAIKPFPRGAEPRYMRIVVKCVAHE